MVFNDIWWYLWWFKWTFDMILQLDGNMLMCIELLSSLMIILLMFLIQRCVWDVLNNLWGVKPVYAVFMYAAMMYDVYLSIKCLTC